MLRNRLVHVRSYPLPTSEHSVLLDRNPELDTSSRVHRMRRVRTNARPELINQTNHRATPLKGCCATRSRSRKRLSAKLTVCMFFCSVPALSACWEQSHSFDRTRRESTKHLDTPLQTRKAAAATRYAAGGCEASLSQHWHAPPPHARTHPTDWPVRSAAGSHPSVPCRIGSLMSLSGRSIGGPTSITTSPPASSPLLAPRCALFMLGACMLWDCVCKRWLARRLIFDLRSQ